MKLYLVGMIHRGIVTVVAAKDTAEADLKARNLLNLHALPVDVQEISEVDGYKVTLKKLKVESEGGGTDGENQDGEPGDS